MLQFVLCFQSGLRSSDCADLIKSTLSALPESIVSFMLKSKTTSSKLLGYKIAVISQATSKAKKQHRKKQQPQKKYNQLFTAAGNVGYVFFCRCCCCLRLVKQVKSHANSALQTSRGVWVWSVWVSKGAYGVGNGGSGVK